MNAHKICVSFKRNSDNSGQTTVPLYYYRMRRKCTLSSVLSDISTCNSIPIIPGLSYIHVCNPQINN